MPTLDAALRELASFELDRTTMASAAETVVGLAVGTLRGCHAADLRIHGDGVFHSGPDDRPDGELEVEVQTDSARSVGTLTLIGGAGHTFEPGDRSAARMLAAAAAVAIGNTQDHDAATREVGKLVDLHCDRSDLLDIARGVVMERRRSDATAADAWIAEEATRRDMTFEALADEVVTRAADPR